MPVEEVNPWLVQGSDPLWNKERFETSVAIEWRIVDVATDSIQLVGAEDGNLIFLCEILSNNSLAILSSLGKTLPSGYEISTIENGRISIQSSNRIAQENVSTKPTEVRAIPTSLANTETKGKFEKREPKTITILLE